jgi:Na+/melibiose symporter-like transporter
MLAVVPGTVSPVQVLGWLLVIVGFVATVVAAIASAVFAEMRLQLVAIPLFVGCAGCIVACFSAGRAHEH